MTKYAVWDLVLAVAGTIYVGLVLFQGIESPLFGGAFVVLAACELKRLHSARPR